MMILSHFLLHSFSKENHFISGPNEYERGIRRKVYQNIFPHITSRGHACDSINSGKKN